MLPLKFKLGGRSRRNQQDQQAEVPGLRSVAYHVVTLSNTEGVHRGPVPQLAVHLGQV